VRLNDIHAKYNDKVRFLLIYIREAHPDDGWRVPENLNRKIRYREPTTDTERTAVATVCQIDLGLQMPMLIDSIDNDVEGKYVSLPMRLYLIDRDGKIAYAGDRGPFGFDPDTWEAAIRAEVAK